MAEEEAAMHKGRGRMLFGLIGIAVVIAGGAGYLVSEDSEQRTYSDIGKKINGMKKEHFDQFYGRHIRDVCMDKLVGIEPKLDILVVPKDFEANATAMKKAVQDLRSGWSDYVSYLVDPKGELNEEVAQPKVTKIARAWYEFRKAHASMNTALIKKLKK
jgi:hypothetical protein